MENQTITAVAAEQADRAKAMAPTLDEIRQARRLTVLAAAGHRDELWIEVDQAIEAGSAASC